MIPFPRSFKPEGTMSLQSSVLASLWSNSSSCWSDYKSKIENLIAPIKLKKLYCIL